MAVRLFVGNLAYSTTEADLRSYFGTVAPPSQVVLPVDRDTGRPLAVSAARAREDRGPGGPRPGGFSGPRPGGFAPRPPGSFGGPRPFEGGGGGAPAPARNRNFGPDAKPQRGNAAQKKKQGDDKPRGPIPMKQTGRSFSLDDVDQQDDEMPDIDDIATSKPHDPNEDE